MAPQVSSRYAPYASPLYSITEMTTPHTANSLVTRPPTIHGSHEGSIVSRPPPIQGSREDSIDRRLRETLHIASSNNNQGISASMQHDEASSFSCLSRPSDCCNPSNIHNHIGLSSPHLTASCQILPSLLPPKAMITIEKLPKNLIKNLHKCAKAGNPRDAQAHLEAMQQLYLEGHTDLKPDVRHYNSVLNAWVKSKEEGKELRAQKILDWMQKLHEMADVNYSIKPSQISFNICITAWCKSKEKDAAKRALNLLDRMLLLYHAGDSDLKPGFRIYKSVIIVLSKNVDKGSAVKAEALLQKMRQSRDPQISPDSCLYNMVIHMYSQNRDANAPQRAEALLNEMHFAFMNGNNAVQPNTITFNTVLNTYAKSITQGSAERAEAILQRMQDLYDHGYLNVEPDTISFNSVINAYANSGTGESAIRAFDILNKMHELYQAGRIKNAQPNIRTYNACLKVCYYSSYTASTEMNAKLFNAVCMLLSQIHHQLYLQADEQTYIWFFRACQANCQEETKRDHTFEWAFHMCCKDKLWTKKVFKEVCKTIGHKKCQDMSASSPQHGIC